MNRDELAKAIADVAHLTGSFRLRSGQMSGDYFDKYQFEARPELLGVIADHLMLIVPPPTEVLAGLELGGVPVATALSLRTGLPAAFVRKAAKSYGTERLAEGIDVSGRQVLLIEDVVTTGGQIVESLHALRDLGAVISHTLCVIDRESGGKELLAAEGVQLRALLTRRDIERAES